MLYNDESRIIVGSVHVCTDTRPAKDGLGLRERREGNKGGKGRSGEKCDKIVDELLRRRNEVQIQSAGRKNHDESTLVNGVGSFLCATTS